MSKPTEKEVRKAISLLRTSALVGETADAWVYCKECKEVHRVTELRNENCFETLKKELNIE